MLIVVVALGVEGRLVAVNKIVVERDGHRAYATGKQLYAKTFARSGLARRRGASNEHHLHALAVGYLFGYVRYLLLLQRL